MALPTFQSAVCSEYFASGSNISVPGGTTWLLTVFRDDTGSDGTSGFTQAGNPMTSKVTGFFSGGNGFYGAYTTTPVVGAQPVSWTGMVGGFVNGRYSISLSDVAALDGSGYGYAAPQTGETVFSINVPSTTDSMVIACFALPGAQVPATLTALGSGTIRTSFSGDGRYIVVTAPGASNVTIGVSSTIANFGVLAGWACSVRGISTVNPFVKVRIKLRGT